MWKYECQNWCAESGKGGTLRFLLTQGHMQITKPWVAIEGNLVEIWRKYHKNRGYCFIKVAENKQFATTTWHNILRYSLFLPTKPGTGTGTILVEKGPELNFKVTTTTRSRNTSGLKKPLGWRCRCHDLQLHWWVRFSIDNPCCLWREKNK